MNWVWKVFFLAISAVALTLTGKFAYALYSYMIFDVSVPAKVTEWCVVETEPSKYQLGAEYTYFFEGEHAGSHLFSGPKYNNSFIAQEHLNQFEKHSWRAFVRSHDAKVSTLQHNFPFKQLIHFLLGVSVLLYFSWLRSYIVSRFSLDT